MTVSFPTLTQDQAQLLGILRREANIGEESFPHFRVKNESGKYELSYAQERLWFLHESTEGNPFYNESLMLDIEGGIVLEAIFSSIRSIQQRHHILRTRFGSSLGVPYQQVYETSEVPLELHDLSLLSSEERDLRVEEVKKRVADIRFDLCRDRLYRIFLIKTDARHYLLVFASHHIIADGWSMGVFLNELKFFYKQHLQGGKGQTEELPVQYRDYAAWEKQVLKGGYLERLRRYWQNTLSGAPERINLPRDVPATVSSSHRGDRLFFEFSSEVETSIRQYQKQLGSQYSLFMILVSVFYLTLNHLGGDKDIVVGTDVANRPTTEAEELVGFFVNQLALRITIDESMSFNRFLTNVRDTCNGAYEHQCYPFDRLVSALGKERVQGVSPVFQVKFVLQNYPLPNLDSMDLKMRPRNLPRETSKFELLMEVSSFDDGVHGWLEYALDYYKKGTAQDLLNTYKSFLEVVLQDSGGATIADMKSVVKRKLRQVQIDKPKLSLARQY